MAQDVAPEKPENTSYPIRRVLPDEEAEGMILLLTMISMAEFAAFFAFGDATTYVN